MIEQEEALNTISLCIRLSSYARRRIYQVIILAKESCCMVPASGTRCHKSVTSLLREEFPGVLARVDLK